MKIVTAIDSFKGSMTSMEAGLAVTEGVHRVDSDVDVQIRPLADGGEGTVEALVAGMNGMKQEIQVTGPLGTPVVCEYGIIERSKTAVIEMAEQRELHWCRMKRRIHFTQRLTVLGK